MSLNAALLYAYRNSHYRVDLPAETCVLQIDQCSVQMDAILRNERVSCASFVSAHNPYSRKLPAEINWTRNAALEQVLLARKLRYLTGAGYSTEIMPAWPPESGFFVLNISAATAQGLGHGFGQNAVVHIEYGQPVMLLFCTE